MQGQRFYNRFTTIIKSCYNWCSFKNRTADCKRRSGIKILNDMWHGHLNVKKWTWVSETQTYFLINPFRCRSPVPNQAKILHQNIIYAGLQKGNRLVIQHDTHCSIFLMHAVMCLAGVTLEHLFEQLKLRFVAGVYTCVLYIFSYHIYSHDAHIFFCGQSMRN